eukprot:g4315.t1
MGMGDIFYERESKQPYYTCSLCGKKAECLDHFLFQCEGCPEASLVDDEGDEEKKVSLKDIRERIGLPHMKILRSREVAEVLKGEPRRDRLQAFWDFEQYLQGRQTKTGNAWKPDFCPFNTKMEYLQSSEWYRAACGKYKNGTAVDHPICKYSGSVYVDPVSMKRGCQCETATTLCDAATMTAAYGVRDPPYCKANLASGCMDLTTEADGGMTSRAACLQATATAGVPSDQMDEKFWCATDSWLSTIGLTNPLLGELSASTNDVRHWNAILNYTNAQLSAGPGGLGLVGFWDGPTRMALSNFPLRTFMSSYIGNLLMDVVHEDIRDAAVKQDCTLPDAANSYMCPVEPLNSMLAARTAAAAASRRLEKTKLFRGVENHKRDAADEDVREEDEELADFREHLFGANSELRTILLPKKPGPRGAGITTGSFDDPFLRRLADTHSYGNCTDDNIALLNIKTKPATVNSCADVTSTMCKMRTYSTCDDVGLACKARCDSFDPTVVNPATNASVPGFCDRLEPAYLVGEQDDAAETTCSSYGLNATLANYCALGGTATEEECRGKCLAIGCQHMKISTYLDLISNRYDLAVGAAYQANGGNLAAAMASVTPGKMLPGCHACKDDSDRIAHNSAVRQVGCHGVPSKACKCAADVGGCSIKPDFLNKMTAEMCPQTCSSHAQSCANPALHSFREAKDTVNAATVLGGLAAVPSFPPKCQGCLGYLQGDNKFAPYRITQCKTFLALIRLRSECELNSEEFERVSNRTDLSLADREDWIDEVIDEYADNYGVEGDKKGKPPTSAHWRALDDRGIDVFIFHSKWLAREIVRVITREVGNLVGTFFLMIFFLVAAIAVKWKDGLPAALSPGRIAVAALVVVQPVLAVLMSWGIGAIEMWDEMGGDVDKDGKSDGVLALTVMSPLAIHLLLAIVVDYDIILVRAFDRLTPNLKFEERVEQAVGYAHRSILLSVLAVFCGYCFGSVVDVLALRHFCWHTAIGMLGLYVTLFSLFLGGFVLAEKYGGSGSGGGATSTASGGGDAEAPGAKATTDAGEQLSSVATWTDAEVQSSMHKMITTTPSDSKFSGLLSHKACILFVILFEIAFLAIGIAKFDDVKVVFNGKDYLDKDSKARKFLDHLEDMGGYADYITVYMPPSSIGQYHIKQNRDHFLSVMTQLKNDPIANPIGVPGVFSWLEEFEVHHKGLHGNYLTSEPLSAATHIGCKACPMNLVLNTANKQLPFAGTATNLPLLQNGLLFTGAEKYGRNSFRFTGINDIYLNGLLTAAGVNVTVVSAKLQAVGVQFPELALVGGGGYELAEVYDAGPILSASPPAGRLDEFTLLYSTDPVSTASDMSGLASLAALQQQIHANNQAAGRWLIFTMRSMKDERYNLHNTFAGEKQTCPAFTTSHYERRVDYWETAPESFYDYVHSWYEDVAADACCTSHMPPTKVQEKPDLSKPHVSYWGREQGANIVWGMEDSGSTGGGKKVTSMRYSTVRIACRAPLDPAQRVSAMKRIEQVVNTARAARPDLWGGNSDSFVVSSFFENSERDDTMMDALEKYLFVVTLAVTLMMMVLLHPWYGLVVGLLMLMVNVQIVGLLALFNVDLDVIVFAVIVMALGFEIEYSIHIVHAFAHAGGGGLKRTETALQDMGLTVFTAFLSTAVQQLVLLCFSTSLAFEIYPAMVILVAVKAGFTGFVFAPAFMGVLDTLKGMTRKRVAFPIFLK